MNKLIAVILMIMLVGVGGAMAAGYRIHPENVGYYFKTDSSGPQMEIIFKDGRTFTATVVEEAGDKIKINVDGADFTFSKSEIEAMNAIKSKGFIESLQYNYKRHHKLHPFITHSKDKSASGAFDNFLGESDRISEKIRKEHPEVSGQAMMQEAMAQAQAAQAQARARQAQMEAEMKNAEGGY